MQHSGTILIEVGYDLCSSGRLLKDEITRVETCDRDGAVLVSSCVNNRDVDGTSSCLISDVKLYDRDACVDERRQLIARVVF